MDDPVRELEFRLWRKEIESRLVSLEEKALVAVNRRLEVLEKQKLTAVYRAAAIAGFLSSVVTALLIKWAFGAG